MAVWPYGRMAAPELPNFFTAKTSDMLLCLYMRCDIRYCHSNIFMKFRIPFCLQSMVSEYAVTGKCIYDIFLSIATNRSVISWLFNL